MTSIRSRARSVVRATERGFPLLAFSALLFACSSETSGLGAAEEGDEPDSLYTGSLARAPEQYGVLDPRLYGRATRAVSSEERRKECESDPRVQLGQVSLEVCLGAELFFREPFAGNGRSCASCHPVVNNYTIDTPFMESLPDDDPLFVAEYDPALRELERPELMRELGLVLENVDGTEAPAQKFVMRSVSHLFSMATSLAPAPIVEEDGLLFDFTTLPPNQRTGWGGDGAPGEGTLRDFARGAVEQHMTRSIERRASEDFRPPTPEELDQLEAFQLAIGRKNELDLTAVSLRDERAERGRLSFLEGPARDCAICHANAGAAQGGFNLNFDIGTERGRNPILNQLGVPFDAGFGREPFDADGDGHMDSFGNGSFNVQSLIESADTAPYFHSNGAETLEDAIRFYTEPVFGSSRIGVIPTPARPEGGAFVLTAEQVGELGAFLRVLNASFNGQIGLSRLEAARQIADAFGDRHRGLQAALLELAKLELEDARAVLRGGINVSRPTQLMLVKACWLIERAQHARDAATRGRWTSAALALVSESMSALGSGMSFELGAGTLMF